MKFFYSTLLKFLLLLSCFSVVKSQSNSRPIKKEEHYVQQQDGKVKKLCLLIEYDRSGRKICRYDYVDNTKSIFAYDSIGKLKSDTLFDLSGICISYRNFVASPIDSLPMIFTYTNSGKFISSIQYKFLTSTDGHHSYWRYEKDTLTTKQELFTSTPGSHRSARRHINDQVIEVRDWYYEDGLLIRYERYTKNVDVDTLFKTKALIFFNYNKKKLRKSENHIYTRKSGTVYKSIEYDYDKKLDLLIRKRYYDDQTLSSEEFIEYEFW